MTETYYKFLSHGNALRSVVSGELRFTPPALLNDPCELKPKFDAEEVRASLKDLRTRGHSVDEFNGLLRQEALMRALAPDFPTLGAPDSAEAADELIRMTAFDNLGHIETLFTMLLEEIASRVGVLCLTKRWNSIALWAHYSDRARGVLVSMDGLDEEFVGDETGLLDQVGPVEYNSDVAGISFYPESYRSIFFSKFKDWEYEYEYRVVSRLKDCVVRGDGDQQFYIRKIDPCRVTGIYLGWMMSDLDRRSAINTFESMKSKNSRCQLFETRFRQGAIEASVCA